MSEFSVSTRYATALMELAENKNIFEEISGDISLIFNTLYKSPELKVILANPIIKEDKKRAILEEIFKSKISNDMLIFLKFIIEKKRENLLPAITKRYLVLRDIKLGIIDVKIKSIYDFSEEQIMDLKNKLENYTKKKVRMSFSHDDNIIGGFIVRFDDTVIDASIKHQLNLLKKKLIEGNLSVN